MLPGKLYCIFVSFYSGIYVFWIIGKNASRNAESIFTFYRQEFYEKVF